MKGTLSLLEVAEEGERYGWKKIKRPHTGRSRGHGTHSTRTSRYPPRNAANRPSCAKCGVSMTHLYYDSADRRDFYGCEACEPPWEGEE